LCEDVALQHVWRVVAEFEQTEFAEVGDEHETVVTEITEGLGFTGKGIQAVGRGLYLDDAALGVLERGWLRVSPGTARLRKEASVGKTRSLVAELCREENWRLEGGSCGVEQAVERRIERRLGGC
jgi:hypothetical protein